jgi:NTP pyrophosphatase (non-canonical NTP hydrolase)
VIPDDMIRSVLAQLGDEALDNSKAWLPDWHEDLPMPLAVGYALGFGGEAGEVLDAVKKVYRDRKKPGGDQRMEHLAEELADAFTYWLLLIKELDIDILTAHRRKIAYNDGRFLRHGKEPS